MDMDRDSIMERKRYCVWGLCHHPSSSFYSLFILACNEREDRIKEMICRSSLCFSIPKYAQIMLMIVLEGENKFVEGINFELKCKRRDRKEKSHWQKWCFLSNSFFFFFHFPLHHFCFLSKYTIFILYFGLLLSCNSQFLFILFPSFFTLRLWQWLVFTLNEGQERNKKRWKRE